MTDGLGKKPPRSRARFHVSVLLLVVYAGFVALVTLWPNSGDFQFGGIADNVLRVLYRFGMPEWFGFNELEFTANIGMFVPLGFFLGLALHRKVWWLALFIIPGYSGAIEYAQLTALDTRVSSVLDVVANTVGGYLGLLVAMILRAMIYARDERIIARAIWERDAAIIRAREHPLPGRVAATLASPEPQQRVRHTEERFDRADPPTAVMPDRSTWADARDAPTEQFRL